MSPRKPSAAAFTFIEVLISMVVLGFGLVVVLQSYIAAANAVQTSENLMAASRFARDKSVALELAAYEKDGLLPGTEKGVFLSKGREFLWSAVVAGIDTPAYLSENTVTASVTLGWKERSIARSASLVSYLPRGKAKEENVTQ